jgi:hypothetical protein
MAMMTAPSAGVDTPTKLYISNLDYNVSNEDIKVADTPTPSADLLCCN